MDKIASNSLKLPPIMHKQDLSKEPIRRVFDRSILVHGKSDSSTASSRLWQILKWPFIKISRLFFSIINKLYLAKPVENEVGVTPKIEAAKEERPLQVKEVESFSEPIYWPEMPAKTALPKDLQEQAFDFTIPTKGALEEMRLSFAKSSQRAEAWMAGAKLPAFDLPPMPDWDLPAFSMPHIEMPAFNLPDIKMPDIKMPRIKFPDVTMPSISLPDLRPVKRALNRVGTNCTIAIKQMLPLQEERKRELFFQGATCPIDNIPAFNTKAEKQAFAEGWFFTKGLKNNLVANPLSFDDAWNHCLIELPDHDRALYERSYNAGALLSPLAIRNGLDIEKRANPALDIQWHLNFQEALRDGSLSPGRDVFGLFTDENGMFLPEVISNDSGDLFARFQADNVSIQELLNLAPVERVEFLEQIFFDLARKGAASLYAACSQIALPSDFTDGIIGGPLQRNAFNAGRLFAPTHTASKEEILTAARNGSLEKVDPQLLVPFNDEEFVQAREEGRQHRQVLLGQYQNLVPAQPLQVPGLLRRARHDIPRAVKAIKGTIERSYGQLAKGVAEAYHGQHYYYLLGADYEMNRALPPDQDSLTEQQLNTFIQGSLFVLGLKSGTIGEIQHLREAQSKFIRNIQTPEYENAFNAGRYLAKEFILEEGENGVLYLSLDPRLQQLDLIEFEDNIARGLKLDPIGMLARVIEKYRNQGADAIYQRGLRFSQLQRPEEISTFFFELGTQGIKELPRAYEEALVRNPEALKEYIRGIKGLVNPADFTLIGLQGLVAKEIHFYFYTQGVERALGKNISPFPQNEENKKHFNWGVFFVLGKTCPTFAEAKQVYFTMMNYHASPAMEDAFKAGRLFNAPKREDIDWIREVRRLKNEQIIHEECDPLGVIVERPAEPSAPRSAIDLLMDQARMHQRGERKHFYTMGVEHALGVTMLRDEEIQANLPIGSQRGTFTEGNDFVCGLLQPLNGQTRESRAFYLGALFAPDISWRPDPTTGRARYPSINDKKRTIRAEEYLILQEGFASGSLSTSCDPLQIIPAFLQKHFRFFAPLMSHEAMRFASIQDGPRKQQQLEEFFYELAKDPSHLLRDEDGFYVFPEDYQQALQSSSAVEGLAKGFLEGRVFDQEGLPEDLKYRFQNAIGSFTYRHDLARTSILANSYQCEAASNATKIQTALQSDEPSEEPWVQSIAQLKNEIFFTKENGKFKPKNLVGIERLEEMAFELGLRKMPLSLLTDLLIEEQALVKNYDKHTLEAKYRAGKRFSLGVSEKYYLGNDKLVSRKLGFLLGKALSQFSHPLATEEERQKALEQVEQLLHLDDMFLKSSFIKALLDKANIPENILIRVQKEAHILKGLKSQRSPQERRDWIKKFPYYQSKTLFLKIAEAFPGEEKDLWFEARRMHVLQSLPEDGTISYVKIRQAGRYALLPLLSKDHPVYKLIVENEDIQKIYCNGIDEAIYLGLPIEDFNAWKMIRKEDSEQGLDYFETKLPWLAPFKPFFQAPFGSTVTLPETERIWDPFWDDADIARQETTDLFEYCTHFQCQYGANPPTSLLKNLAKRLIIDKYKEPLTAQTIFKNGDQRQWLRDNPQFYGVLTEHDIATFMLAECKKKVLEMGNPALQEAMDARDQEYTEVEVNARVNAQAQPALSRGRNWRQCPGLFGAFVRV